MGHLFPVEVFRKQGLKDFKIIKKNKLNKNLVKCLTNYPTYVLYVYVVQVCNVLKTRNY